MNQCFPQQPEIKGDTHTHTPHTYHTQAGVHTKRLKAKSHNNVIYISAFRIHMPSMIFSCLLCLTLVGTYRGPQSSVKSALPWQLRGKKGEGALSQKPSPNKMQGKKIRCFPLVSWNSNTFLSVQKETGHSRDTQIPEPPAACCEFHINSSSKVYFQIPGICRHCTVVMTKSKI